MSNKKNGVKAVKVITEVPTIQLIYPVSDTLEALEEDYKMIGYSDKEAEAAARSVFNYDSM